MQDPLKQGLKLKRILQPLGAIRYSNARSIKTRIETIIIESGQSWMLFIRMQDPLKQGLKLCNGTGFPQILAQFECKIH